MEKSRDCPSSSNNPVVSDTRRSDNWDLTVNDYMNKLHFKMETLKSALTIVTPNCLFGCIDLKQAYFFSIPVSVESQGWFVF